MKQQTKRILIPHYKVCENMFMIKPDIYLDKKMVILNMVQH
jgi:7,8-dihydro-6-hydroxymethylpterin-pyrophosphokinase